MGTLKQTKCKKNQEVQTPKNLQIDRLKRRFQNFRFVWFSDSLSVLCVHMHYAADLVEQDHRDPKVLAVWGSLIAGGTGAILANWNELKSQISQFLCYSWAHSSLHSWVQLVVLLALKTQSHSNYDYDWTFWHLDLAHLGPCLHWLQDAIRMLCSCKLASHGTFSPRHRSLRIKRQELAATISESNYPSHRPTRTHRHLQTTPIRTSSTSRNLQSPSDL